MLPQSRRAFLGRLTAGGASLVSARGASAAAVRLVVPADGGTPRDPSRIVRVGDREFRIAATAEEGRSALTHAVSRVDLIIDNPGPEAEVVLHIDVSGDGSRPNFDTSPYGGMPRRDFAYIQIAGKPWQRVEGTTQGWVATLRFQVPAGETRFGLGPWYTYADYLAWIGSLPQSPYLRKDLIGKSDGGREHWELTITDPATPADRKQRILWHAREHSYETFSSFAAEGLVAFLLSPEAQDYRRRFVFSIQPMVNIDGVANGFEYRTGYDYPQPRGTATGRLTFESVDRLKPHYVIAWHNWIAPRDTDVVFYTDSADQKATRRAWDLFTQRFPSPRAIGHRWQSETNPVEKNWFGRKANDSNVHSYAMNHYGTRVWGWEMPWFGRDQGDPAQVARRNGAAFGHAFLETLRELEASPAAPADLPLVEVRCRETHEWELRGRAHVENPFRDAALVGEFVSPSGKLISLEGFYCGGDLWKVRFVPEEAGEWRYLLRGEGVALRAQGKMLAQPPREKGFIRIHPQNPYAFAYSDGTPFFPMGDTCYGLHDDTPITPQLRREYLDTRRRQRFNFVRMSIGHSAKRAAEDPAFWAWGGTASQPDLDRFNPRFFDSLEAVLREMHSRGMNAELLLLNYYRTPFTDPKQWTPEREKLWLRYVIARLASFPNVFLWTVANEFETHPDGRYRLDNPGDLEWAKAIGALVHQLDPYRHPLTVHPVVSASAHGPSPRDKFDPPWRIGEFFGPSDAIDVLSHQTSVPYQSAWNEEKQCWTGDQNGVEDSIAADRRYRKPVLNTEHGYEYLPEYPTNKRQVYHTDSVRRASWRIVCAGGYFAAGFISTLGHSDAWDRIEPGKKHPFLVRDAGAAVQLAALYDFFNPLPYWRMNPRTDVLQGEGLCLAADDECYVIYLPHGGRLQLRHGAIPARLHARWFNPRLGQFHGSPVSIGQFTDQRAPDEQDWVLLFSVYRS